MRIPEILAPAGGPEALRAAVRAGADAVYFGLRRFSARARAENFDPGRLRALMTELHEQGVRGYVALNTLIFDHELGALGRLIETCAEAGADALIVQELGALRLARTIAPTLPIHVSTQATAASVEDLVRWEGLGAQRAVLPRELDLESLAEIRGRTRLELEVFVHGALCISLSGQCLASFAFGGRSSNRGECAQPCRLGYGLLADGVAQHLGGADRILSPRDLDASELVPRLAELGIHAFKIEGRLKGPDYVGASVALYRAAVEAWRHGEKAEIEALRRDASLAYSRGRGPGWLGGCDPLGLVDGHSAVHRGLEVGTVRRVRRQGAQTWVVVELERELERGAGLAIGQSQECAGRVWSLRVAAEGRWLEERSAPAGSLSSLWFGPEVVVPEIAPGAPVHQTDDPALPRRLPGSRSRRVGLSLELKLQGGAPLVSARAEDGRRAETRVTAELGPAPAEADRAWFSQKLGRLGDTPFELRELVVDLPKGMSLPASSLNRARRALVAALSEQAKRTHPTHPIDIGTLAPTTPWPEPLPPGWFVLVRRLAQVEPVLLTGVDGLYLELDSASELARAESLCRARGVVPGRVTPRTELGGGRPSRDATQLWLVRTHGALGDATESVADATLHAANRLSVGELLGLGARAVTPAAEVDEAGLRTLASAGLGPYLEVVVYQHLPLFFTRHCLHARLVRARTREECAGVCRRHALALVDRTGAEHPLRVDADCWSTVFEGRPRELRVPSSELTAWGIRRLRVELMDENAQQVSTLLRRLRGVSELRPVPAT